MERKEGKWDSFSKARLVVFCMNHNVSLEQIVFCCYNLLLEKFFHVLVTYFPSYWEQEDRIEKRLGKFEAKGQEFVTFQDTAQKCVFPVSFLVDLLLRQ